MDFFQSLLPCPESLQLEHSQFDALNHQITLLVSSKQTEARCPICHARSHRVHSHYERTLKDLSCLDFCLVILLQVCKFFCLNESCQRRIFTERLPQVTLPWARRTIRLTEHLNALGLALGGAAAARLSYRLHFGQSRNTVLRCLSKLRLPTIKTPRILGVDDFAFRRGQHYGTILVDLEKHHPIALLPDRQAQTFANWLKAHPGVEIISRDRSKTYRSGARQGAPHAIQVADRFHLLQNLETTLEDVLSEYSHVIKAVDHALLQQSFAHDEISSVTDDIGRAKTQMSKSRERRLENYEHVHALRQKGYLIKDIAHHLGIGKRTVYKYLASPTFPEYKTYTRHSRGGIDPYKPYLIERWKQGQHNAKYLFQELQKKGFHGSYSMVVRFTRKLRQTLPIRPSRQSLKEKVGRGPLPALKVERRKALTVQSTAWLVMRKLENLTPEDKQTLEKLKGQPELSTAIELTQRFLFIARKRLSQHLDSWIERAKESTFKPFQRFAKGLLDDYDAVKAGLTLEVSNGQVEGQNNRVKQLKRQMFGRAGLKLLEKRLIMNR